MKFLLLAALAVSSAGPRVYLFHRESVLGTSLELKVSSTSESDAKQAEVRVLAEVDRLSKILSGYDPASEFSRWAKTSGPPVTVSAELAEVLALWDRWGADTGGALNPSIEVASRLWRKGEVPGAAALAAATAQMRGPHWRLTGNRAERLTTAPLMLNSFTKSWIIERAARAALGNGHVSGVMLNIGGDLVARGAMFETVALANPRDAADNARPLGTLVARDLAVATSGDYHRGFDIGGHHYSHIIDPRTAMPVSEVISATVVSPDAVEAGALATAFNVLSPAESARLAVRHPRAEYLLIAADGKRFASKGWPLLFAAAAEPASSAADVQIDFELARGSLSGGRRHYVAVWIEDKDKVPVCTLALWFDKTRWLPELTAWWRSDRLRALAEGTQIANTISSATRSAGKYSLKWDGTDQAGRPVKPGKYTVILEAAREHGSHDVLRQPIEVGVSGSFSLTGQVEIVAAKVEVKKAQ